MKLVFRISEDGSEIDSVHGIVIVSSVLKNVHLEPMVEPRLNQRRSQCGGGGGPPPGKILVPPEKIHSKNE